MLVVDGDDRRQLAQEAVAEAGEAIRSRGLAGMPARVGLETIHRFRPGFLEHHVELLLPELVVAFEPHWSAGHETDDATDYLIENATAISHDLLAVTDTHAAQASDQTAIVVYERLRPFAVRRVADHMPRIASLVHRWVAEHESRDAKPQRRRGGIAGAA